MEQLLAKGAAIAHSLSGAGPLYYVAANQVKEEDGACLCAVCRWCGVWVCCVYLCCCVCELVSCCCVSEYGVCCVLCVRACVCVVHSVSKNAFCHGSYVCVHTHASPHPNSPLAERFKQVVERLLAAGDDLANTTEAGETPLHQACVKGSPTGVRVLVALGANPTSKAKCVIDAG